MKFVHDIKVASLVKKKKLETLSNVIVECSLSIFSHAEENPEITTKGNLRMEFEINVDELKTNFIPFEQLNAGTILNWLTESDQLRLDRIKQRQEKIISNIINPPEEEYEIVNNPWQSEE